jgi:hypothetical protein
MAGPVLKFKAGEEQGREGKKKGRQGRRVLQKAKSETKVKDMDARRPLSPVTRTRAYGCACRAIGSA